VNEIARLLVYDYARYDKSPSKLHLMNPHRCTIPIPHIPDIQVVQEMYFDTLDCFLESIGISFPSQKTPEAIYECIYTLVIEKFGSYLYAKYMLRTRPEMTMTEIKENVDRWMYTIENAIRETQYINEFLLI
jgi:hypothetical protein